MCTDLFHPNWLSVGEHRIVPVSLAHFLTFLPRIPVRRVLLNLIPISGNFENRD